MKIFSYLTALTAVLGACSTAPTSPTPGSAAFDPVDSDYLVTQNGVTRVLLASAPRTVLSDGVTIWYWPSGGGVISGFARSTGPTSAVAAGLDNGTYFAGVSGTYSTTVPISGGGTYSGAYAFVVNGVDQNGSLSLTADFVLGSLVDTTAGIDVIASITGASIDGTVTIGGETGTLTGGFYNAYPAISGAAVGANMAGIIVAN